jgi:hypothetical protein
MGDIIVTHIVDDMSILSTYVRCETIEKKLLPSGRNIHHLDGFFVRGD